jgi:hypothetical protein
MKRRWTYRILFYDAKPIHYAATCEAQAVKVGQSMAKSKGWKFQTVGVWR